MSRIHTFFEGGAGGHRQNFYLFSNIFIFFLLSWRKKKLVAYTSYVGFYLTTKYSHPSNFFQNNLHIFYIWTIPCYTEQCLQNYFSSFFNIRKSSLCKKENFICYKLSSFWERNQKFACLKFLLTRKGKFLWLYNVQCCGFGEIFTFATTWIDSYSIWSISTNHACQMWTFSKSLSHKKLCEQKT